MVSIKYFVTMQLGTYFKTRKFTYYNFWGKMLHYTINDRNVESYKKGSHRKM